jgi:hypothetical protein
MLAHGVNPEIARRHLIVDGKCGSRYRKYSSLTIRTGSSPVSETGPVRAVFAREWAGFGGVTASTEMLAARRHTGAHSPVSGAKTIIANSNQFAYAA